MSFAAGRERPEDRADIYVWTGRELGSTIMQLGLHDWVMERLV
ncbi:hypothetical protein [Bradyrhizobium sp. CCBAU 21359]|nr:hypothetical protein [Bradyrhizobium sp. CCBAU 21359]